MGFVLGLLFVGLVAGFLARLLVPGRDPMSIGATLLLGVVGAIIGGVVANALFDSEGIGLFSAVVTSIVLLLVLRTTRRGHTGRV